MILTHLKEKLALIPDEPKLVVLPKPWPEKTLKFKEVIPEALIVQFPTTNRKRFQEAMLEVFSKRWQTVDLVSMMHEVKRTFPLKTVSSFDYARPISSIRGDSSRTTIIDDHLSSLPRLQKTEENSKTWRNPNWPTCPFKPFRNFPVGLLCWSNFFSIPPLSP